jgi:hypothetical protein
MLYFEFWSHDRSVDLLIDFIRQIRPHEQIEIWSHDRKFDLMKKLNFDLMTFDLMIISQIFQLDRQNLTIHIFFPQT